MKYIYIVIILLNINISLFAITNYPPAIKDHDTINYPETLRIDTNYNYIQFYSPEVGQKFLSYFNNADNDKVVIFHFGASHVQGELLTTYTRTYLQNDFGDGGRGMIFNYSAAKSFSSKNYSTEKKGDWNYVKNYHTNPKFDIGVMGMSVETADKDAELNFTIKNEIPYDDYKIIVFFENDNSSAFNIKINDSSYSFSKENLIEIKTNYLEINYFGKINEISLKTITDSSNSVFRFYGINIEKNKNKGLIYNSFGVASAPIRSFLNINKMEEQSEILKPDIFIIDYGTNDIIGNRLLKNSLTITIKNILQKIHVINPEAIIILTSTQDIYYKGRYNRVAPEFRDLIDSISKAENLMFWNWYDLSGGLRSIRNWHEEGYAQRDCVHLNHKGYELKGSFLYTSIINTVEKIKRESGLEKLCIENKNYDKIVEEFPDDFKEHITYTVKSGDTLSAIAEKFNTTVTKIKRTNNLKSDMIRIGQIINI